MGFDFTEISMKLTLFYITCAVRENAESKVFGKIGELKHKKKRKPSLVTALCGCMAEQDHVVERIKRVIRIWILCLALMSFITYHSYYMHF